MNKTFEFNTKDRLELREMFYREQSSMANNFIDRIEQIISERITPEPGESGQSADEIIRHYCYHEDPLSPVLVITKDHALQAMRTYASQVCADKGREIEVIQTDWQNKVDGWIMGYRYLEKELSAAKQTIAENDKIINESVEAVSVGLRTMIDRRKKIESLESELDKANESITVLLRKNAELEAQIDQFTNPLRIK